MVTTPFMAGVIGLPVAATPEMRTVGAGGAAVGVSVLLLLPPQPEITTVPTTVAAVKNALIEHLRSVFTSFSFSDFD
jgi:hypothetical protein